MMVSKKTRSMFGFTLVEVLLSLMIMGIMLAAAAVAIHAAAINFTVNEDLTRAMNTARQSLLRITTDLRTAQSVAFIGAGEFKDADNSLCSLETSGGDDITYRYDSGNNTLYLVTNDDLTDADYVLCENVTAITFDRTSVDPSKIRNVQISITVTINDISQTLATAAVIRRNL
jgi:prepilin-type N-terminal cleavage/methylation domain-containing protein